MSLLQRAKDEVAQRYSYKYDGEHFEQWSEFFNFHNKAQLINPIDEVAELYAKYSREEEEKVWKSHIEYCLNTFNGIKSGSLSPDLIDSKIHQLQKLLSR